MRKTLLLPLAICLICAIAPPRTYAQGTYPAAQAVQDPVPYEAFSAAQLDNLLSPVALYPDALLAQVLVAATFPDQIDEASRWVRANGATRLDDQWWDISVRAVAHYPTVLYMMSSRMDWTTSLGQAYVSQSTDVMEAVQRLRAMANAQGNLVSTPEQQVIVDGGYFEIVPAQPQVIYVPTYDPTVIYFRHAYAGPGFGFGGFWSFGAAFPIGGWLTYDCDWREHHVYYDGWRGGGWRARARPYVHLTNVYINPRLETVHVNRDVVRRPVNVNGITEFNSVHRDVTFENRVRPENGVGRPNNPVNNKVIERNVNTRDPQVDNHRGRDVTVRQQPGGAVPVPTAPVQQTPVQPTPVQPAQPMPRQTGQPAPMQRPRALPPQMTPRPVPVPAAPPTVVTPRVVPQPTIVPPRVAPQPSVVPPRAGPPPQPVPPPHAFGRSEGGFDPRVASQRGQASRTQQAQRPAPPPPPPQSRPARPEPTQAKKRPQ